MNDAKSKTTSEPFIMKPKVDFCFKELMTDPEVRRGFISALLGVKPEEIVHTELLPTFLRKEHKEDKPVILDVRVQVQGRGQMDMEIQVAPFELWAERSIFYLSKMYAEQIQEGSEYDVLQKCIHVGILDFNLFPDDPQFYSRFHLWEDSRRRLYTDKLEIHIIELPKLKCGEYPETELWNWAKFFDAECKEEFELAANTDPYITKAYEKLMHISADAEKRLEYEAREKAIRDYNWQMKSNWRNGHKEGKEEGRKEGRKEGVEALILTLQELSLSRDAVAEKLQERFELSGQEAEEYVNLYWRN